MARQFLKANNQYLSAGSALATAVPISFAFFYYTTAAVSSNVVLAAIANAAGTNGFALSLYNSDRMVRSEAFSSSPNVDDDTAESTTVVGTLTGQYHIVAVYASATSRLLYVNGANPGSSAVSVTPAGVTGTYLGGFGPGGPFTPNCIISWSGIWKTALSAIDAASLAAGAHPRRVRPDKVISMLNLTGGLSPEPDMAFKGTWSYVGTGVPAEVPNPPIFF